MALERLGPQDAVFLAGCLPLIAEETFRRINIAEAFNRICGAQQENTNLSTLVSESLDASRMSDASFASILSKHENIY